MTIHTLTWQPALSVMLSDAFVEYCVFEGEIFKRTVLFRLHRRTFRPLEGRPPTVPPRPGLTPKSHVPPSGSNSPSCLKSTLPTQPSQRPWWRLRPKHTPVLTRLTSSARGRVRTGLWTTLRSSTCPVRPPPMRHLRRRRRRRSQPDHTDPSSSR